MEEKEMYWKDLNIKSKMAIYTAMIAFALGWLLTIAAFIVPPTGVISDSVLFVLGQALIYAASVFGITNYFTAEARQMKKDLANYVKSEVNRINE